MHASNDDDDDDAQTTKTHVGAEGRHDVRPSVKAPHVPDVNTKLDQHTSRDLTY